MVWSWLPPNGGPDPRLGGLPLRSLISVSTLSCVLNLDRQQEPATGARCAGGADQLVRAG